jgi:hypothetical protein
MERSWVWVAEGVLDAYGERLSFPGAESSIPVEDLENGKHLPHWEIFCLWDREREGARLRGENFILGCDRSCVLEIGPAVGILARFGTLIATSWVAAVFSGPFQILMMGE